MKILNIRFSDVKLYLQTFQKEIDQIKNVFTHNFVEAIGKGIHKVNIIISEKEVWQVRVETVMKSTLACQTYCVF